MISQRHPLEWVSLLAKLEFVFLNILILWAANLKHAWAYKSASRVVWISETHEPWMERFVQTLLLRLSQDQSDVIIDIYDHFNGLVTNICRLRDYYSSLPWNCQASWPELNTPAHVVYSSLAASLGLFWLQAKYYLVWQTVWQNKTFYGSRIRWGRWQRSKVTCAVLNLTVVLCSGADRTAHHYAYRAVFSSRDLHFSAAPLRINNCCDYLVVPPQL